MRPGMSAIRIAWPGSSGSEARAHQIEIGDAIDFVVVGNAAVAIAEADLRPHVQFDLVAARSAAQRNARPAGQPSRGNGQAISRQPSISDHARW